MVKPSFLTRPLVALLALLLATGTVLAYVGYLYHQETIEFALVRAQFASTTAMYETKIKELNDGLVAAKDDNTNLLNRLQTEQQRNNNLEGQVNQIVGTVTTLEKLSRTDRELLQKYSKVYFLNEHYVPSQLINIDPSYVYEKSRVQQIHAKVWPYLEQLLKAAAANGTPLEIISAYRSFGEQSGLKSNYRITYGAGTANQFSADQGYSEHQLGTTVDFTTPALGATFSNFKTTTGYQWLLANAYKFGFVLSYPEHNAYYIFEPWHWRFVGVKLATKLHDDNKYFYDLGQRVINDYLVNIFD